MTSRLLELCIAAEQPQRLAGFWAGLLERETDTSGVVVRPGGDAEFALRFRPGPVRRSGPNQVHLHLTSETPKQQQATVDRALGLGGRHLDVGQTPEEGHVVLADPEGNEFCVIEAGNSYLADTAFLGELACDGTREVGHFWGAALGWPLVWEQDEETAIQSPLGGAKLAWGGPPVRPRSGPNVMHFHVSPEGPATPAELDAEVDRLVSLGATRLDDTDDDARSDECGLALADPDGNEFCLLTPREGG